MPNLKTLDDHLVHVAEEVRRILGHDVVEEFQRLVGPGNGDGLRSYFEKLLDPLYGDARESFEKLVETRIFLEEVIAFAIVDDDELRSDAKASLEPLLIRMNKLASVKVLMDADFEDFWQLDGQFHAMLGKLAKLPHIEQVVQTIQSVTAALGTPLDRSDMEAAHREHQDIVEALTDPFRADDNMIKSVIMQHAQKSFERWLKRAKSAREKGRLNAMEGMSPEIRKRVSEIAACREKKLGRSLRGSERKRLVWNIYLQVKFPGEYVAWNDRLQFSEREIIHSPHWVEIDRATCGMPAKERETLTVLHISGSL